MSPATSKGRGVARWILRLALAGVFLYAGVAKMRDARAFAESLTSFKMLPEALITPVALALPPTEIFAAVLSVFRGKSRRLGAFCLLAMLAIFSAALASALVRGLQVNCGCFGADRFDVLSPTKNLWVALGRDAILGVVAGVLYADARRREAAPAKL